MDTIRLFIGCDPNNCDLEQLMVLVWSLKKHTRHPLDITLMHLSRDFESFWYSRPLDAPPSNHAGWETGLWPTPFSGFRWAIPAFCHGKGKAIYMDADIFALSDIAELWDRPIPEGKVMLAAGRGAKLRLGTLVWDCERAVALLPSLDALRANPRAHHELKKYFESHPELIEPLPPAYSNLDGDNLPVEQIKFLHYSDMGSQFSHKFSIPRLSNERQAHWFDGTILPHPRPDLEALFDEIYHGALRDGASLEEWRIAKPFGPFPKKSQVRYKGNEITRRASKLLGFLKRS